MAPTRSPSKLHGGLFLDCVIWINGEDWVVVQVEHCVGDGSRFVGFTSADIDPRGVIRGDWPAVARQVVDGLVVRAEAGDDVANMSSSI